MGAALIGIEKSMVPAAPIDGNCYEADLPQLPDQWSAAIAAFESGALMPEIFSQQLRDLFVQLKRQELARFLDEVSPFEVSSYAEHI